MAQKRMTDEFRRLVAEKVWRHSPSSGLSDADMKGCAGEQRRHPQGNV
jgi:hypothetical protein